LFKILGFILSIGLFILPQSHAQDYSNEQVIVVEQPYEEAPQEEVEVVDAQTGRGIQYGGHILVPVWLGDAADAYNIGVGVHLRVGYELGAGLSFEGGVGLNSNKYKAFDDNLNNLFLTGGARYAILNPSALVPFLQGGVQANLWKTCAAKGNCSDNREFTIGYYIGTGLVFELNVNAALELGANFHGTTKGDVFDSSRFWISPFAGITLYY